MRLLLPILFLGFNLSAQSPGGGVTDIDGNTYESVIIGTQEWMAENLRTTRYSNGDIVPNVTDNAQWSGLNTGAWCHFNNDIQFELSYGKLYNWFTVSDNRFLCPTGWRIPTDVEYSNMIASFDSGPPPWDGDYFITTGTLEAGTGLWNEPNNGTNSSNFSAVPSGHRLESGSFLGSGNSFEAWTSVDPNGTNAGAYCVSIVNSSIINSMLIGGDPVREGKSVRCIKGAPLGIIELKNEPKELMRIVDLMGREAEFKTNTTLIYIYSDGTSERVFMVE